MEKSASDPKWLVCWQVLLQAVKHNAARSHKYVKTELDLKNMVGPTNMSYIVSRPLWLKPTCGLTTIYYQHASFSNKIKKRITQTSSVLCLRVSLIIKYKFFATCANDQETKSWTRNLWTSQVPSLFAVALLDCLLETCSVCWHPATSQWSCAQAVCVNSTQKQVRRICLVTSQVLWGVGVLCFSYINHLSRLLCRITRCGSVHTMPLFHSGLLPSLYW